MTIIVENSIQSQHSVTVHKIFFVLLLLLYMTETNKLCYYNTGNDVLALVGYVYAMYFSPLGLPIGMVQLLHKTYRK